MTTNSVLYSANDWYISYNPSPSTFLDEVIGVPKELLGKDETAICHRDPWKCLILYGDHREAYKALDYDLTKCHQYFLDNKDLKGYTSDDLNEEDIHEEEGVTGDPVPVGEGVRREVEVGLVP